MLVRAEEEAGDGPVHSMQQTAVTAMANSGTGTTGTATELP